MQKLINIQKKLKAPKSKFNSFGKYKYRSCEDILEAVKPLLAEEGCTLTLSDDILMIGDRFYVKATATITDGTEQFSVSALAREDESKKGMDGSQITGTASSYARKYALNGLLLIDDTKDADTDEYANTTKGGMEKPKIDRKNNEPSPTGITPGGVNYIMELCEHTGTDPQKILDGYKVKTFYEMSMDDFGKACKVLENRLPKEA